MSAQVTLYLKWARSIDLFSKLGAILTIIKVFNEHPASFQNKSVNSPFN